MSHLELVALVVRDYDAAIRFFVDVLQFELVEDTPSLTNDGRPKRWVVIRPDGGQTGILLACADGDQQTTIVGQQFAGRVGMFLRVDDFDTAYQRMVAAGVRSSRRRAMSHTADSQCFWILRGTAGTSWDETRGDRRQSATVGIRSDRPASGDLRGDCRRTHATMAADFVADMQTVRFHGSCGTGPRALQFV